VVRDDGRLFLAIRRRHVLDESVENPEGSQWARTQNSSCCSMSSQRP
jgi:hypothetical protein